MNKHRLKMRLVEIQMSQAELAKKTGISQVAIHKLCSGKTKESKKSFVIAKALNVSVAWLLGASDKQESFGEDSSLNEISGYFDLDDHLKKVVRELIVALKNGSPKP
jgi:transcriptional regulator with XRE-family HTH domain